jgi:hypothetical protein
MKTRIIWLMLVQLGGAPTTSPATKGTPRKRDKVADGETPSKSGSKRKTQHTVDEDDEEGGSPTKKQAVKEEKADVEF